MDCKVIVDNELILIEPNIEIRNYFKRKLTIANPEYSKKLRMGFYTGTTPKNICLYKEIGRNLILPYGELSAAKPDWITFNYETRIYPQDTKVDFKNIEIPLYDYQEKAVTTVRSKYVNGILNSPTASGKTQMGIALIVRKGCRALWLTHTKDLLDQAYTRAKTYIPEEWLGTITEGKVNIGSHITFATVQTLSKLDITEYKRMFGTVIVDECHRCVGTPASTTMFYKVLNGLSAPYKFGLTATVHRSDGLIQACLSIIGEVKYRIDKSDIADKIMQVGICKVNTPARLGYSDLNPDGTVNYTKLINCLVGNVDRNEIINDIVSDNKEHFTLILTDRVEHMNIIYAALDKSIQRNTCMVTGKTNKKLREKYLADMREGNKRVLLATYSLAKEGLDIPLLDRLILATPHKDYAVITQSIGRIARTHKNKKDAICYDLVDNIGYCQKAFKKRMGIYRKADCYQIGDYNDEYIRL